jgi:moderate conductance mechanosensitive channel
MMAVPGPLHQLDRPSCADQAGSWCQRLYDLTNNEWLSRSGDWLIAKPAKILLILAVAFVVRYVAHRAISKLTRVSGEGRVPTLLRPLKEHAHDALAAVVGPLLSERRAQRARTIGSVLRSLASFLVLGIAFVLVIGELGINLAPIVASAGIVGLALGFGAQNLVKDFLSGIFMMLEDQYGVGDVVDLGEASGVVEAIGLRVTTLRDVSGTVWYVRNGEVLRVGNSSQGYAVAVVDLPLAHTADIARATELATSVATETTSQPPLAEHVLEPPVVLGIESVTPDTVTLRLTVKVRAGRQWAVQRALLAAIKSAFDTAGILAPYPTGRPVTPTASTAPPSPA